MHLLPPLLKLCARRLGRSLALPLRLGRSLALPLMNAIPLMNALPLNLALPLLAAMIIGGAGFSTPELFAQEMGAWYTDEACWPPGHDLAML